MIWLPIFRAFFVLNPVMLDPAPPNKFLSKQKVMLANDLENLFLFRNITLTFVVIESLCRFLGDLLFIVFF